MNTPKWPAELPQTYDVVNGPVYECDEVVIRTNAEPLARMRQTSAYHRIETRCLRGTLTATGAGILQDFAASTSRFEWGDEQGVQIMGMRYPRRGIKTTSWRIEVVVDIFPSFLPDDVA